MDASISEALERQSGAVDEAWDREPAAIDERIRLARQRAFYRFLRDKLPNGIVVDEALALRALVEEGMDPEIHRLVMIERLMDTLQRPEQYPGVSWDNAKAMLRRYTE